MEGYSFIMHGGLEKEKSSSSQLRVPDYSSRGKLRTFCVHKKELLPDTISLLKELLPDIISHLTSVRLLSLRDCNLQGLPKDIGRLLHLRYLNVSENPITELPETITDLCNLQTLDIERCRDLSSLPEGIEKLINLRHLVNTDTNELVEFPQGLGELSGLRTLNEFKGSNLGLLRNMNQLQGPLYLKVEDFVEGEFGEPNLCQKQHIEVLELKIKMEETDEMVEALKPPPNLQSLFVGYKSSKWLSRWITSFDKLKLVDYYMNWSPDVPPFGKLPALEELQIYGYSFNRLSIGFLGVEDANARPVAGGFPRLKKLHFETCADWKEWEDIEQESFPVMTSLEELIIHGCWRLKGLPHNLLGKASSLRVVKISSSKGLYARYNEESGYHRHDIPLHPNQIWTIEE